MENLNNCKNIKPDIIINMNDCDETYHDNADDVDTFFKSNYASSIKTSPTPQPVYERSTIKKHYDYRPQNTNMTNNYIKNDYINLDVKNDIQINLLEAYHGCIKEKIIKRNIYLNNTFIALEEETICIDINSGVLNNEKIIIHHKGHSHSKTQDTRNDTVKCDGNLIITVQLVNKFSLSAVFNYIGIPDERISLYNISNHDYYSKIENDLYLTKYITLKEALCGYSFVLPHLSKKVFKMNSSQNTIVYHGKKITIPLYGFTRNDKTGSLIIEYHILFPSRLSDKQKQLLLRIL